MKRLRQLCDRALSLKSTHAYFDIVADKRFLGFAITTAAVLAFTWGLYFYVTSVAGFEMSLFETMVATSALLVAFAALAAGLAWIMKSRRANRLDRN